MARARVFGCGLGVVLLAGIACAPHHEPESRRPAERVVAPREFTDALAAYLAVRERAEAELASPRQSDDPMRVVAQERALATAIRRLRPQARQGDVFTPATIVEFRRVIAADLRSRDPRDAAATARQAPPITLRVNEPYPDTVSLAAVPPMLLLMLPRLPPVLEYRFGRRHLILLDADANLVVDFIADALPAT